MKRQAGPPSQLLTTVQDAKAFSHSSNETRAIGFFTDSTSSNVLELYMESGNEIRMDMELGHCTDPSIAQDMGFRPDTVVVFHPRYVLSLLSLALSYCMGALTNSVDQTCCCLYELN